MKTVTSVCMAHQGDIKSLKLHFGNEKVEMKGEI